MDSAGEIVSEPSGPSGPMSDERYAQILAELDEVRAQREAFQREGQYKGRHFLEWIPDLDRLRSEKRDDEALAILWDLVPISDRAYRAWGQGPGGWVEHRIAVIFRRRKLFSEEVALVEEFLARHPEADARKMRARLDVARRLSERR